MTKRQALTYYRNIAALLTILIRREELSEIYL
jgi:hypothetical protein